MLSSRSSWWTLFDVTSYVGGQVRQKVVRYRLNGISTECLTAKHTIPQDARFRLWLQVRVMVPEIAVSMDAQEFQILQDVASHMAAEQVSLLSAQPQHLQSSLFCRSQACLPSS